MDILTDYVNKDVMLDGENINSFEREIANTINGSASHNDTEAVSHPIVFSSQNTV